MLTKPLLWTFAAPSPTLLDTPFFLGSTPALLLSLEEVDVFVVLEADVAESLLKWALLPAFLPLLTFGLVTIPFLFRRDASGDLVGSLTPEPAALLTPDPDPDDPFRPWTIRVGESTSGILGGSAGAVGLVTLLAGRGGGGLEALE